MNEIEKVLKDVVYGSVGAVTTMLEVGGELAKTFVEKGQEAVRQGQERAEEMKQAMKEACDAMMADPGIDISDLNRAQRDELRRQLDEMDAAEDAAAAEAEATCECSEPAESADEVKVEGPDEEPSYEYSSEEGRWVEVNNTPDEDKPE